MGYGYERCRLRSGSFAYQQARRISDDCGASRHVLRYHGAHAHDRALADPQRDSRPSLSDRYTGTDICAVAYVNVAVAANPGSECHEVANNAIVRDVAVDVAMEVASDTSGGRHHSVIAKHSAFAHLNVVADNCCRREKLPKPIVMFGESPARATIGDTNHYFVIVTNFGRTNQYRARKSPNRDVREKDYFSASRGGDQLSTEPARSVNDKPRHLTSFSRLVAGSPLAATGYPRASHATYQSGLGRVPEVESYMGMGFVQTISGYHDALT